MGTDTTKTKCWNCGKEYQTSKKRGGGQLLELCPLCSGAARPQQHDTEPEADTERPHARGARAREFFTNSFEEGEKI